MAQGALPLCTTQQCDVTGKFQQSISAAKALCVALRLEHANLLQVRWGSDPGLTGRAVLLSRRTATAARQSLAPHRAHTCLLHMNMWPHSPWRCAPGRQPLPGCASCPDVVAVWLQFTIAITRRVLAPSQAAALDVAAFQVRAGS